MVRSQFYCWLINIFDYLDYLAKSPWVDNQGSTVGWESRFWYASLLMQLEKIIF